MSKLVGRTLVAAVSVAVVTTLAVSPVSAADEPLHMVSLGDSAAAGPLVPPVDPDPDCLRSDANYPTVAAGILGAELTDVSCSGATMADFGGRQFGRVAPQYDALAPDTDLVSVTVGGNDVDLTRTALSCVNLLPEPVGISCADRLTEGGKDELDRRIAEITDDFAIVLDEIERRSPDAQIIVVGYGTYIREGGCYPALPIWARDATYIHGSLAALNGMLREQVESHGGRFVDAASASEGHDVCAAPGDRYLEGLIPTSPAAPLHPNKAGMAAFGAALAASAG